MPHIEIKYSDNLNIDFDKVFDIVEKTINKHDNSAGVCKSRAYPCSQYKYSHMLTRIFLLTKPNRDEIFTQNLGKEIEKEIKNHLNESLYFSLSIEYSSSYYLTNIHLIEGDKLQRMENT